MCFVGVIWAKSADVISWNLENQGCEHQIPTPSPGNLENGGFRVYVAVKGILNTAASNSSNVLLVLKCNADSEVPVCSHYT